MSDTIETPPVFTDVAWKDFSGTGLTSKNVQGLGWEKQHDLAVEAWKTTREFCELDHQQIETLISAVGNRLPVVIRHKHRLGGTDRIETTTATYVVDQFLSYSEGTTANIYVRRWGFAYPLSLREIEFVGSPDVQYSYDPEKHSYKDCPQNNLGGDVSCPDCTTT